MSGPIPSESARGDPRSLMRGIASARVAAGEKHAEILFVYRAVLHISGATLPPVLRLS